MGMLSNISGVTGSSFRLTPAAVSGPPAAGLHFVGEEYADASGARFWCMVEGTPGTWVKIFNINHGHSSVQLTADQSSTIAFDPFSTLSTSLNGTEKNVTFENLTGDMKIDFGGKFRISASLILDHSGGDYVDTKIRKNGTDYLKQFSFIGSREVIVPIEVQADAVIGDAFDIEIRPNSGTIIVRMGSVFNIQRIGDI